MANLTFFTWYRWYIFLFFAVGTGFEPVGRFRPMVFLTTIVFTTNFNSKSNLQHNCLWSGLSLNHIEILQVYTFDTFLWSPISPATHINFNLGSFYIVSTHCLNKQLKCSLVVLFRNSNNNAFSLHFQLTSNLRTR